jgi:hypothetical protein
MPPITFGLQVKTESHAPGVSANTNTGPKVVRVDMSIASK